MTGEDRTTPRPWYVIEKRVVSTNHPLPGHRFRTVADCRYRSGEADAALIVEAVNRFKALTAVADLARKYVAYYGYPARGIDGRLDEIADALAELDRVS